VLLLPLSRLLLSTLVSLAPRLSSCAAQTNVFQIAPDRITFSAKNSGTSTSTKAAFGSIYAADWSWVLPSTYSTAYSGGIFKAPRDGLYYFTCKVRHWELALCVCGPLADRSNVLVCLAERVNYRWGCDA
jgi:hypothetical protein